MVYPWDSISIKEKEYNKVFTPCRAPLLDRANNLAMRQTIIVAAVALVTLFSSTTSYTTAQIPKTKTTSNGTKTPIDVLKELHQKYGPARLVLKDRGVYKKITVYEINDEWLVFLKDGSLHDMSIERIARIEYGKEYGPRVTFNNDNKIVISY